MVSTTQKLEGAAAVAAYQADPTRERADVLIRRYKGLAFSMCRKWITGVGLDDIGVSTAALMGIWAAIKTYDPTRGMKFTSWLGVKVKQHVLDELRTLGYDKKRRVKMTVMRERERSLDEMRESEGHHLDTIPMREDGICRHARIRATVRQVVHGLTRDLRLLVMLYFVEGLTLKESGKAVGYSESRASMMIKYAMSELRKTPGVRELLEAEI